MTIVDSSELNPTSELNVDVCIVGAGPAGITVARELAANSTDVLILESGGLTFEESTASLNRGVVSRDQYPSLESARLRYFGGTSNHWSGQCTPLSEYDFAQRSYLSAPTGWPIQADDLRPYYPKAATICDLNDDSFSTSEVEKSRSAAPLAFDSSKLNSVVSYISPPTRFGIKYRAELERAENIRVVLHANVVEILLHKDGQAVERLHAKRADGSDLFINARKYVLAAGGIENPRILLASRAVQSTGVGNRFDLVGRFFMDHPITLPVLWQPRTIPDISMYRTGPSTINGRPVTSMGWVEVTPEEQKRLGIAGFRFYPQIRSGWIGWYSDEPSVFEDFDLIADRLLHKAENFFDSDQEQEQKYVEFVGSQEMLPNWDSRVTLIQERDAMGMHRVELDVRYSSEDYRTIDAAAELFAKEITRLDMGSRPRIMMDRNQSWPPFGGRFHHMGTTRMHDEPRNGVVDGNCKVHGVQNLYISGSSVFPTCGSSVPTLTIVALALRLAQHLKTQIGR